MFERVVMQEILVRQEESGQRLDKYLRRRLPLAPSSFIYKMLRKKNITLRGKKADGSEKVETGDSIKLFLSDETIAGFCPKQDDAAAEREAQEIDKAYRKLQPLLGPSPVLYEDEHILLVRKPSGVLSQKADAGDLSMNEWLRGYLSRKENGKKEGRPSAPGQENTIFRPSVCNRLDRNTGGILLCAKSLPGSRALSEVIRDRVIRKTYTMVVHGQIHSSGVIDADLIKDREENQVRIADGTCTEDGRRRAVTIYRPVKTGTRATVVEADLITGRSHQLRVHMASIGHPIVSDPRYGDRRLDQSLLGALQQKQTRKERMQGQRQAEPAQKDRKESGTQKGRRGIRDHSAHRGQLLWCSETAFPKMLPDRAMPRVLTPVAGRVFQCPPPRWWYDLCDI